MANVVAFTGTNTGRVYEVNKVYSNGNGSYIANSDGSFTNVKTNRVAEGSSRSATATFYVSQAAGPSLSSGGSSGGRSVTARSGVSASKPASVGSGPGVSAVEGHPGGFSRLGHAYTFGKNDDGTFNASQLRFEVQPNVFLDTTAIWIGGKMTPIDPTSSDVQDYQSRYGDDNIVVSTAGAVIVGGMDAGDAMEGSWSLGDVNKFLNNAASSTARERDRARTPVEITVDTPEFKRPSWPN